MAKALKGMSTWFHKTDIQTSILFKNLQPFQNIFSWLHTWSHSHTQIHWIYVFYLILVRYSNRWVRFMGRILIGVFQYVPKNVSLQLHHTTKHSFHGQTHGPVMTLANLNQLNQRLLPLLPNIPHLWEANELSVTHQMNLNLVPRESEQLVEWQATVTPKPVVMDITRLHKRRKNKSPKSFHFLMIFLFEKQVYLSWVVTSHGFCSQNMYMWEKKRHSFSCTLNSAEMFPQSRNY